MSTRLSQIILCLTLVCGCYQRSAIDPASISVVSPFKESSLYFYGPPMSMTIQLKDSEQPLLETMPDTTSASLISSKGIRYPVRFLPNRMSYDGATGPDERDRAMKTKSPWVGYCFAVMDPQQPERQLDNLPDGPYKFAVIFAGPSGTHNLAATFKRRTQFERIQVIDH